MTETIDPSSAASGDATGAASAPAKKRGGGLSSMLLADLKSMASDLGVPGAGSMKKAQLVEAIKARQSGGDRTPPQERPQRDRDQQDRAQQESAQQ